ncbi:MAG: hypothetical protein ACRD6N_20310, partial [Pyrinomonadaceae bacterium]
QMLWKMPPTFTDNPDGSGGLRYWMGEMAMYAAFKPHGLLGERSDVAALHALRVSGLGRGGLYCCLSHAGSVHSARRIVGDVDGYQPLAWPLKQTERVALDLLLSGFAEWLLRFPSSRTISRH